MANKENPTTAADFYSKGNEAFVSETYPAAIELYTSALGLEPHFADCMVARAHAYIKSDKFDLAKKDADKAIDILRATSETSPTAAKAFLRSGVASFHLGRYKEAKNCFTEGQKLGEEAGLKQWMAWCDEKIKKFGEFAPGVKPAPTPTPTESPKECEFNKSAKILLLMGSVFGILAVIMYIVGHVGASASTDWGFKVEGSSSATFDVAGDSLWGYEVSIKETEAASCSTHFSGTVVKDTNGDAVTLVDQMCKTLGRNQHQIENDPPLVTLATFYPVSTGKGDQKTTITGSYTITSSTEVWVVDTSEELGEAVGGVLGGALVVMVGLIFALAGSILCCVACCCMCTGDSPQGGGGTVIGQPVGGRS